MKKFDIIIGGGPAGLSALYFLSLNGYNNILTLFEFLLNRFQEVNEFGQVPIKDYANSLFEREYVGL